MRKVVASEFLTLDGVMDAPHEWIGGIHFTFFNEEANQYANETLFSSDALLLGRVIYQAFAEAWPSRTGEYADRINAMPKYVVSKTLDALEWNNSRLVKGNVADEVRKLKQEAGQDILIFGSRQLVNALLKDDLIDEYRIWVDPIVVGKGRRLFDDNVGDRVLKLVDSTTLATGVVILKYEPRRA